MPISVTCPCGKKLNAPDTFAGKKAKCPVCKQMLMVPEPLEVIEEEIEFIDDAEEIDEVPLPKAKVARPKTRAEKIEENAEEPESRSDAPEQTAFDRKLSGDTQASNPGNVKVDFWFSFQNYPTGTLVMVAIGLVLLGLGAWNFMTPNGGKSGAGFVAVGIGAFGLCAWGWYMFSRTMIYGCANPGVVVDVDQGLVAVITDLDCGIGEEHWVIKITKHPLSKMTGGPGQDGMRLGTVAGYAGDPNKGHWDTFEPWVVNCLTRDKKRVKKVLSTFSARDWALLNEGLKEVPTPYKAGQWRVLEDMEEE